LLLYSFLKNDIAQLPQYRDFTREFKNLKDKKTAKGRFNLPEIVL